jgi:hypothetical protein
MKSYKELMEATGTDAAVAKRVKQLIKDARTASSNMEQLDYMGNLGNEKDKSDTIRNLGMLQDDLEDLERDVGILKRLIKDSK